MLIHNLHQHASIVAENTNTTKQNAPLFGKECRKCGKPNQFESMCKSGHKRRPRQQRIRALSDESDDESNDYFEIHTVTLTDVNSVKSRHSRHIFATMNIIGKNENTRMTRFQLDMEQTVTLLQQTC